jgi:hypothetical protein
MHIASSLYIPGFLSSDLVPFQLAVPISPAAYWSSSQETNREEMHKPLDKGGAFGLICVYAPFGKEEMNG